MTPEPLPEKLYKLLGEMKKEFGDHLDQMRQEFTAALGAVQSEMADMRVRMAETGVLSVRVDTVEKEISRVEKRSVSDIETMIQYVTRVRDEAGNYRINHGRQHHATDAKRAEDREAFAVVLAQQAEALKQLGGKWATVKGILIPLVVGVLSSILTAVLASSMR